jgi:predicted dienelactone hydrolase
MLHMMFTAMLRQANYQPLLGSLTPVSAHVKLARQGDRDLELRITYPQQPGKYPLIVFSHGLRGSMDSYDPLIKTWVSHGYICIQPNHADSFQYFKDKPREAFQINASTFTNWSQRPQEMSMVIDRISEIERQVPGLAQTIDLAHIGMGGHSYGAHTSSLLAGAKPRTGQSFKERRASAILLISPQGQGNGFSADAWLDMTGPVMCITGSEDVSIVPTTPELRRMPFDKAPAGNKYLLWIDGAYHGMGGISGRWFPTAGEADAVQLKTVQTSTLMYWDAYLKDDTKAKQFLISEDVRALSNGKAHFERR